MLTLKMGVAPEIISGATEEYHDINLELLLNTFMGGYNSKVAIGKNNLLNTKIHLFLF